MEKGKGKDKSKKTSAVAAEGDEEGYEEQEYQEQEWYGDEESTMVEHRNGMQGDEERDWEHEDPE
eukprot:7810525-Prorocentrum_lima.AAC.1